MGQFSPCDVEDIEKETENGEDDFLKFVSSNIKSWKKINLNAFISKLSQGEQNNYEIFCIIDGNKGNEVTKFVQNHFLDVLLNQIKINKEIKSAIKESFLKINKLMQSNEGMKEIVDLRLKNNEEEIKNFKNLMNQNENPKENKKEEINIFEEEDKEILDYTGCTLCLILIDTKLNKLYFGNIGNTELFIYKKKDSNDNFINIKSFHRPEDKTEKLRIKNNSLIINNKLYGLLTSARTFGNFAYNEKNKIIIDEPDIQEYDLSKEDKYIIIANEAIVNIYNNENNILNILKKKEEEDENFSLDEFLSEILDNKIPNYFFINDTKIGFDTMTCTLIKLKN